MLLFCEPANFLILNENRIHAACVASNAVAHTRMQGALDYVEFIQAPLAMTARFRLTRWLAELRGHGQGAYASAFSDPLVRKKCRASHIAVTAIAVR